MPAKAVARELLRQPNNSRWARSISNSVASNEGYNIPRASVGRILAQMEAEGWLTSQRELRSDSRTRLPRLYFRITELGFTKLREFLGIEQQGEGNSLIIVGQ